MEDPNVAIPPDYTTDDFGEEQEPFIDAGLTPAQAATALQNHWTVLNNREKVLWQQIQHDANEARVATQERADQLKAQQEEDKAQILQEERKKNKMKYAPIPDRAVSSCPLVLPSLVAIRKLKAHQFCKLWYFTNTGLDDAEKSFSYAADEHALSIVPGQDRTHSFVPSVITHDKSCVTQDENLTFEQFSQATICMIDAMVNNGWQQEHVDMHVCFWSSVENHKWRYSRIDSQQRALLLYQGNQRRFWHVTIGRPQAFNLAIINEEVLADSHNRLVLKINSEQHRLICKSSPSTPRVNPRSHLSLFSQCYHNIAFAGITSSEFSLPQTVS